MAGRSRTFDHVSVPPHAGLVVRLRTHLPAEFPVEADGRCPGTAPDQTDSGGRADCLFNCLQQPAGKSLPPKIGIGGDCPQLPGGSASHPGRNNRRARHDLSPQHDCEMAGTGCEVPFKNRLSLGTSGPQNPGSQRKNPLQADLPKFERLLLCRPWVDLCCFLDIHSLAVTLYTLEDSFPK